MADNDRLDALRQTADDDEPNEALCSASDETLADGDPRARESPDDVVPERIGRYVVIRRLGAGTMGMVYEAHDELVDRRVALKLLGRRQGRNQRLRLVREGQALAQLSHPNVVNVFEVGTVDEHAYLVMELVEGQSLDHWLREEPRSVPRILDAFVQAGRGLAAAHEAGFVHRDFKPSNVLVGTDGRMRVLDFGLARASAELLSGEQTAAPTSATGEVLSRVWAHDLTHAGAMMGTPAFMSPEQLGTEPVTAKSDQFGFCVALYAALYHQHPFVDELRMEELVHNILFGRARQPPERPDVPARVRAAVLRGLATDPAARWPSMDALLRELRDTGPPMRWRRWIAVSTAAGLALMASAWVLLEPSRQEPSLACSGAEAKLAEVWGPSQRTVVQQAFAATGRSYAAQTWERVEPALDDHAARWAAAFATACEAGHEDAQLLDQRMACLDRLHGALGTQVEIFSRADAGVVEQAVEAVTELRPAEACLETDLDPALIRPSRFAERRLASRYDALVRVVERIDALVRSGRYDDALAEAERAVDAARALDHAPLLARALISLGKIQEERGASELAQQLMEQAYFLAQESGSHELAQGAAIRLMKIVGVDRQNHDGGLDWARHAEAELGPDTTPAIRNAYHNSLGLVLLERGKYEEALGELERALAALEPEVDAHELRSANTLGNIGIALRKLDRIDESIEVQERGLAKVESALGSSHPYVAQALRNLSTALYFQGPHRDRAIAMAQRSLAILEAAFGPEHVSLSNGLSNLSVMLAESDRLGEAEVAARRALEILEQLDVQPLNRCRALINLAYVEQRADELEHAAQHLTRAVHELEVLDLGTHPETTKALIDLGDLLRRLERFEESDASLRKALSTLHALPDAPAARIVRVHELLAEVALAQGRPDEASNHALRALESLPEGQGQTFRTASLRFVLARAQWTKGRRARNHALANAREAARLAATLGDADHERELRERILAWRAGREPTTARGPTRGTTAP
ncbi:tetratricopeptide repeat-containing serine/threonine-protein kinase [Paraliomyxa miuraensis]|uniref:tetratricopeptide repeat-containing serine/threonine-protein kinase n=1 Tax=Paraliomyxa miuraensis TaxID=376150 RepID=UPI00225A5FFF|nr:tetratricopeptide repeat-containing serine/threonine-protein kinase [Paraliomyxa miuraensis]MCX4240348.1 serine/threonine-protein kinase [Paraliomyxa miuraensis]